MSFLTEGLFSGWSAYGGLLIMDTITPSGVEVSQIPSVRSVPLTQGEREIKGEMFCKWAEAFGETNAREVVDDFLTASKYHRAIGIGILGHRSRMLEFEAMVERFNPLRIKQIRTFAAAFEDPFVIGFLAYKFDRLRIRPMPANEYKNLFHDRLFNIEDAEWPVFWQKDLEQIATQYLELAVKAHIYLLGMELLASVVEIEPGSVGDHFMSLIAFNSIYLNSAFGAKYFESRRSKAALKSNRRAIEHFKTIVQYLYGFAPGYRDRKNERYGDTKGHANVLFNLVHAGLKLKADKPLDFIRMEMEKNTDSGTIERQLKGLRYYINQHESEARRLLSQDFRLSETRIKIQKAINYGRGSNATFYQTFKVQLYRATLGLEGIVKLTD